MENTICFPAFSFSTVLWCLVYSLMALFQGCQDIYWITEGSREGFEHGTAYFGLLLISLATPGGAQELLLAPCLRVTSGSAREHAVPGIIFGSPAYKTWMLGAKDIVQQVIHLPGMWVTRLALWYFILSPKQSPGVSPQHRAKSKLKA